ncbi:hypothetical protein SDC9_210944 [bioreactor metagenome]|uniref:Uncharacterized protein n=1 Tax=bioreactor metagenome TaxID=1076179 RepID=A0A645JKE4_9ZZZZ
MNNLINALGPGTEKAGTGNNNLFADPDKYIGIFAQRRVEQVEMFDDRTPVPV